MVTRTFLLISCIVLWCLSVPASIADNSSDDAVAGANKSLGVLREALANGDLSCIDVYYISDITISEFSSITPEYVEAHPVHRLTEDIDDRIFIEYLLSLVERTRVTLDPSIRTDAEYKLITEDPSKGGDYTWGCVFIGRKQNVITSMFFCRRWGLCSIDSHHVQLSGGIYEFLKQQYHDKITKFERLPKWYERDFQRWWRPIENGKWPPKWLESPSH